MFKGFGDIAGLIKNAREILDRVSQVKESLAAIAVEGLSGGGMVRVQGRADGVVLSVFIDPDLIEKKDRALTEELVLAAFNHFRMKLDEARKEKMLEITAGLNLPPGFDLGL